MFILENMRLIVLNSNLKKFLYSTAQMKQPLIPVASIMSKDKCGI